MKTVINIKTYMCPSCRFHRAVDNLPEDGLCPVHKLTLQKTTNPEDKITVTVMDVADLPTHQTEVSKDVKRNLTPAEQVEWTAKINADITKFKALEDK